MADHKMVPEVGRLPGVVHVSQAYGGSRVTAIQPAGSPSSGGNIQPAGLFSTAGMFDNAPSVKAKKIAAIASIEDETKEMPKTCAAVKDNGEWCTARPMKGGELCVGHARKAGLWKPQDPIVEE